MPNFGIPTWQAPGFDQSHPASDSTRFSAVALSNAGFINILTGARGTLVGTPTASMTALTGVASTTSNANYYTFSGLYTPSADTAYTIGAITTLNTVTSNSNYMMNTGNNGGSNGYGINTNNTPVYTSTATALSTGLAPTVGAPIFILFSGDTTVGGAFVEVNLTTGKIRSVTSAAPTAAGAGLGSTWQIGSWFGHAGATGHALSAIMYASQKMQLQEMLQWAQDPWSFWYPDTSPIDIVGIAAAAAGRHFLPLLNVG